MGEKSSIEWLLNPYTGVQGSSLNDKWGCTKISPACLNCYIPRTMPLRMRGLKFDRAGIGGRTGIVLANPKVRFYPLTRWARSSRMIFVNSLSELWHAETSILEIAEMYAVMLLAGQHVFLTLTKRTRRMRRWLCDPRFAAMVAAAVRRIVREGRVRLSGEQVDRALACCPAGEPLRLPLHVWTGSTIEDNRRARQRLPELFAINSDGPLWASAEPLTDEIEDPLNLAGRIVANRGQPVECEDPAGFGAETVSGRRGLDWIVFGGESGPAAKATPLDTEPAVGLRPISLENLGLLIGQARMDGAAVFVKQLGEPWAREHYAGRPKEDLAADKAGRNMAEWPEHLRVRQYPRALAEHTLTVDPGNELAQAALAPVAW